MATPSLKRLLGLADSEVPQRNVTLRKGKLMKMQEIKEMLKKGRMLNGELKYEATGVQKSTKGELAYISLVVFSKGGRGVSHDN